MRPLLVSLALLAATVPVARADPPGELTVDAVRAAIASGDMTCEDITAMHFERISHQNDGRFPPMNAVVEVNPHAIQIARDLDAHYAAHGFKGPLHCAPLLLKDNYDTFDHPTTASSRSMLGSLPPDDAFTVARLREAGAVVLGKTTMTEFAYYTSSFNSRTLRVGDAYDTRMDAGGSSGGTGAAIASNLAVLGTGSDTCASIRLPSSNHSLVGIRSSVGLVSQDGLVPLSHTQDVAGPMTRTVRDAVLMLDAMAGPDPADPKTLDPDADRPDSYLPFLRSDGLEGKRIGVLRTYGDVDAFGYDETFAGSIPSAPGRSPVADSEVVRLVEAAAADMARLGATIVDPVDLPDFTPVQVIVQEFQTDIDRYLASFDAPRENLIDIITSGMVHPVIEAILIASVAMSDTTSQSYFDKLALREAMREYVEAEMDRLDLDALIFPPVTGRPNHGGTQGSNCILGSTTSGPSVVVPAGFTDDDPALPVGVEIYGRTWDEPTLIEIAYAYEQGTHHRRPPVN